MDKTTMEATLVSADPENDVAVLKVPASPKLRAAPIGTSSDLMIGETAIALGNPFGLENSVSVGVISAKNRSIIADGKVVYNDFIQTDAAVNPGNSGGPLLNIQGDVVGINTAVHAEGQGIGFAIPIDKVISILEGLLDYRVLKEIWVGVQLQRATPELAAAMGIGRDGLIVTEVEKGSPAAEAGLAVRDVITAVNGKKVPSVLDFNKEILGLKVGDTVAIESRRDGKERRASLKLAQVPPLSPAELTTKKLGLQVQAMTRLLAQRLGLRASQGLLVTEIERGGPAAAAGLQQLDVIVQVDRFRVAQPDHLGRLLPLIKPGTSVQFIIIRGNYFARTVVKVR
jgi:serine protease Do